MAFLDLDEMLVSAGLECRFAALVDYRMRDGRWGLLHLVVSLGRDTGDVLSQPPYASCAGANSRWAPSAYGYHPPCPARTIFSSASTALATKSRVPWRSDSWSASPPSVSGCERASSVDSVMAYGSTADDDVGRRQSAGYVTSPICFIYQK